MAHPAALDAFPATLLDGPELRLSAGSRREAWQLPRHANVHYPLFDDFVTRLLAGEAPRHSGEEGLHATRIIQAAYESARTGRITPA